MDDTVERIVRSALDRVNQTQYIPGGVVGVVAPAGDDDQAPIITTIPFGVGDVSTGQPVDADTSFEIGSLTKLFTAAIFASAVADPALDIGIDSPVQGFAPVTVPEVGQQGITVGHLVTHRSGLPKMPGNAAHGPTERPRYSQQDLWSAAAHTRLLFPPGFSWLYSNFGFGMLGTVLSQLTGRSYASQVDEIICQPLGLGATALEHPADRADSTRAHWWNRGAAPGTGIATPAAANIATGYGVGTSPGRPVVAPRWNNTGALAGSGGLVSTGTDMTRFLAAATGYGSSPAGPALTLIRQQVPAVGPDPKPMGMAWQIREPAGQPRFLFKNGGTSGMHCAMAVRPRQSDSSAGWGVLVLTNGPDHVDDLVVGLLAAVSAAH